MESWTGADDALTSNPVSSYHLLRRLVVEYDEVLRAIEDGESPDDSMGKYFLAAILIESV